MSQGIIVQFKTKQQPTAETSRVWTLDTPLDYVGVAYFGYSDFEVVFCFVHSFLNSDFEVANLGIL